MKVLSRNVAGINERSKLHAALNSAKRYDIALFQETKLTISNKSLVRLKWGSDQVFLSSPGSSRRGAITLFNPRCSPTHLYSHEDPLGQFILNVVIIKDQTLLISNIYGDPDTDTASAATMDRVNQQMDHIHHSFQIQSTIMAGDFNMVLVRTDTTSMTRKPRSEARLTTMINHYDLYDIAALQSDVPAKTYFRHRLENTCSRYDRFYCSANLIQGIEFKILNRTGDHAPITIATEATSGSKQWRFSDSLLSDASFLQGLHDTIRGSLINFTNNTGPMEELQNMIDLNEQDSPDVLAMVIRKVRDYCMKKTKQIGKSRKDKEKEQINTLVTARNNLNNDPQNQENINSYEEAQQSLLSTQNMRSQAASNTNFINHASLSERMSRYHFSRRQCRTARDIPRLVVTDNRQERVIEGLEVARHMTDKYIKIAQVDPTAGVMTIQEFLGPELTASLKKCPREHYDYLLSPVLPQEINDIIKNMKTISCPGPLGITNLLLKEIAPFLTTILADLGTRWFFDDEQINIPGFIFHRIVVFVLKPGKSARNEESYRGLSMLENIFKIFSKVLSERIKRPLLHLQHEQQMGFTADKGTLEASRTVLDIIKYANETGQPLIALSTDFWKAFDSIAINHIEETLKIYEFPDKFITAYMRLTRNGTAQFEVNNILSDDTPIQKGVGQGDPKSAQSYNLAATILNHYLAKSPEVPRFKVENMEIPAIFFADDELNLFTGTEINAIVATLKKISQFRKVSGLTLNLSKCEFLAINVSEADIQRLVNETGMKHTQYLKHLGLYIDSSGNLPHEKNIAPLVEKMSQISSSYSNTCATPLGRSIWAKYLICSKYLHRLQNYNFSHEELSELRKTALEMTWTRSRAHDDTVSTRVHIAADRVAQPLMYGGISLPDPEIQSRAVKFAWLRKFMSLNHELSWVKVLEHRLAHSRRPTISEHLKMGARDWEDTANAMEVHSSFWSHVFQTISSLMTLSHKYDQGWNQIPILGYENTPNQELTIGSLSAKNPAAMNIMRAGLVTVGQLFHVSQLGNIDPSNMKTYQELETDFNIRIPFAIRNSIAGLVRRVKLVHRVVINTVTTQQSRITTLQSMVAKHKTGCSAATQLYLRDARNGWDWGPYPRSYRTYANENLIISMTPEQFAMSFSMIRNNLLSPAIQWTSLQILLRTLWTKIKESNTARNLLRITPSTPECSNCQAHPERTLHLMYSCQAVYQMWIRVIQNMNDILRNQNVSHQNIILNSDLIMFNHTPPQMRKDDAKDLVCILMIAKHTILRIKYRDNQERMPTVRLFTISVALEIERNIMTRKHHNKQTNILCLMANQLKESVGF